MHGYAEFISCKYLYKITEIPWERTTKVVIILSMDQSSQFKLLARHVDFFHLRKDADPDIPILNQAKAEYAKLR